MNLKPIHLLGNESIVACGWMVYTGGIIIENTTIDKNKVTCKNCLKKPNVMYRKYDPTQKSRY